MTFASFLIAEESALRPHCDGPTVSATATVIALNARANAALRDVESVG